MEHSSTCQQFPYLNITLHVRRYVNNETYCNTANSSIKKNNNNGNNVDVNDNDNESQCNHKY